MVPAVQVEHAGACRSKWQTKTNVMIQLSNEKKPLTFREILVVYCRDPYFKVSYNPYSWRLNHLRRFY